MLLFLKHFAVQFVISVLGHDRFASKSLYLGLVLILQPTELLQVSSLFTLGLLVEHYLSVLFKLGSEIFFLLGHPIYHALVLLKLL